MWTLDRPPYDVQRTAFDLGKDERYYGYFLEQGLGKTALCYADFLYNVQMGRCDFMVVIAPNYLKSEWIKEARELGLKIKVTTWPDCAVSKDYSRKEINVVIINYEALLGRGAEWLKTEMSARSAFVALDESSRIKNFQANTTKTILAMRDLMVIRRELNGTPMTENVMELWSQLRFIGQLNGMNPYSFRNRFAIMGGWMGKQIKGVRNEDELHEIMSRCSFRGLKKDWLDLPEKIYLTRDVELSKQQVEAYRSMQLEMFAEVGDQEFSVSMAIHVLMKLQQITRGFIMEEGVVTQFNQNPAMDVTREYVKDAYGKTLIFAHHTHSVDELTDVMGKGWVTMRGGMSQDELADIKLRFNSDNDIRGMILQDTIGQKGHTLLGQADPHRCSNTLYYENTYSRETRSQTEDRNHRIGQDRAVTYTDLLCAPIDTKTIKALQIKADIAAVVVDAYRSYREAA